MLFKRASKKSGMVKAAALLNELNHWCAGMIRHIPIEKDSTKIRGDSC